MTPESYRASPRIPACSGAVDRVSYMRDRAIGVGEPRLKMRPRGYDPPPFDSFGRSVTVTVVVHENNSCATFVAEHATVVVPIRN
jgi:hypothetical protein